MRVPGQKYFVPASIDVKWFAGMARSYKVCSNAGGLMHLTGAQQQ